VISSVLKLNQFEQFSVIGSEIPVLTITADNATFVYFVHCYVINMRLNESVSTVLN